MAAAYFLKWFQLKCWHRWDRTPSSEKGGRGKTKRRKKNVLTSTPSFLGQRPCAEGPTPPTPVLPNRKETLPPPSSCTLTSQSHFQVPRVQNASVALLAFVAKNVSWIQFASRSEMWRPAPDLSPRFLRWVNLGDDETAKVDLLLLNRAFLSQTQTKCDYGNNPQCPFVHF